MKNRMTKKKSLLILIPLLFFVTPIFYYLVARPQYEKITINRSLAKILISEIDVQPLMALEVGMIGFKVQYKTFVPFDIPCYQSCPHLGFPVLKVAYTDIYPGITYGSGFFIKEDSQTPRLLEPFTAGNYNGLVELHFSFVKKEADRFCKTKITPGFDISQLGDDVLLLIQFNTRVDISSRRGTYYFKNLDFLLKNSISLRSIAQNSINLKSCTEH